MAFQAELQIRPEAGLGIACSYPLLLSRLFFRLGSVSLNVIVLSLTPRLYISSTFHLIFSHSSHLKSALFGLLPVHTRFQTSHSFSSAGEVLL